MFNHLTVFQQHRRRTDCSSRAADFVANLVTTFVYIFTTSFSSLGAVCVCISSFHHRLIGSV